MAVEKSSDQVCFVAVEVAGVFFAGEITEERLGDFSIRVRCKRAAEHGGSDGQIEQAQPAAHAFERAKNVVFALEGDGIEAGRDGYISADRLLQQPLVEALHGSQDSEFPLRILNQAH